MGMSLKVIHIPLDWWEAVSKYKLAWKNEHKDKHDDVIFVLNPCIPGRQFNLYPITDMTFNSEDWEQICKPNSKQMIWYSNHSYHLLSKIPHPTRRRWLHGYAKWQLKSLPMLSDERQIPVGIGSSSIMVMIVCGEAWVSKTSWTIYLFPSYS